MQVTQLLFIGQSSASNPGLDGGEVCAFSPVLYILLPFSHLSHCVSGYQPQRREMSSLSQRHTGAGHSVTEPGSCLLSQLGSAASPALKKIILMN